MTRAQQLMQKYPEAMVNFIFFTDEKVSPSLLLPTHEWAQFDQSIIDSAIGQWRRRLNAYVRARGAHFEHKF